LATLLIVAIIVYVLVEQLLFAADPAVSVGKVSHMGALIIVAS